MSFYVFFLGFVFLRPFGVGAVWHWRMRFHVHGPTHIPIFSILFRSFVCVLFFFLSTRRSTPYISLFYFFFYLIEKENEATVSLVSWCGGGISSFTAVGSALFLSFSPFLWNKNEKRRNRKKRLSYYYYCWCMYINDVAHSRPCGFGHPSPRPPNGFTFQNNCFPPTLYVSLSHS